MSLYVSVIPMLEHLFSRYQSLFTQRLPTIVLTLMCVLAAWHSSQFGWMVIDYFHAPTLPSIPAPNTASTTLKIEPKKNINFQNLQGYHLFEPLPPPPKIEPPQSVVKPVVITPKAPLNAILHGTFVSKQAERSYAILSQGQNMSLVYLVGQFFAEDAILKHVANDYVIFDREGQEERLYMLGREPDESEVTNSLTVAQPTSAGPSNNAVILQIEDKLVLNKIENYRRNIKENPISMMGIVRGGPEILGGKMIGFKVNTGRDRDLLQQIGLRPQDVVIDVNGVPLNNFAAGITALQAVQDADEFVIKILRDGKPQTVFINLKQ